MNTWVLLSCGLPAPLLAASGVRTQLLEPEALERPLKERPPVADIRPGEPTGPERSWMNGLRPTVIASPRNRSVERRHS